MTHVSRLGGRDTQEYESWDSTVPQDRRPQRAGVWVISL